MKTSLLSKITGPVLISAAASLGIAALLNWKPNYQAPFEDGVTQIALEKSFNEAVPIREFSISAWNALRYTLFDEMLDGGVAGRNGWLYSAEEYRQPIDREERLEKDILKIVENSKLLMDKGISVTIALVPDKARIVPEQLLHERSPWLQDRYDRILNTLIQEGINVVDLRPSLQAIGQEAFLRQDTHWSALGAKAAAKAVSQQIGVKGEKEFITKETGQISYQGDLTNFVSAGQFAQAVGLGAIDIPQWSTTEASTDMDAAASLFGDSGPIPGALVGTSYSAIDHWNFLGALKEALSSDIMDYSAKGQGPFKPMQDYLNSFDESQIPEFLVWEVPERYLTIDP